MKKGGIVLQVVRKRKTLPEIFAETNYDGEFVESEEIDWGPPQGEEIW